MKIRKSYLSIALMALTVQTGMAQEQKRDSLDTGKVYEIGEVVVTGTRNETDVRHLSQTVSVVNRSKIDQALQPSLLPVLTEQIPGLFVTSRGVMGYGVSGGAAGSISLRGLSRPSPICRHFRPSDSRCLSVIPCRAGGSSAGAGFGPLRLERHGRRHQHRNA